MTKRHLFFKTVNTIIKNNKGVMRYFKATDISKVYL